MDPNVKAAEKENQALGWAVSPNPWVNLASGMAIVTLALMLISYNEARSVAGIQALSNGVFRAMSLPDNVMFPAYEGKLTHVSGRISGVGEIVDPVFNIKTEAVCLIRRVETNLWVERAESGEGGLTGYSYQTRWTEKWIDSTRFAKRGHNNPDKKLFQSKGFASKKAGLGVFKISPQLCAVHDSPKALALKESDFANMPDKMRMRLKLKEGALYQSFNVSHPAIGDTKISYWVVEPGAATALALQTGDMLSPAKNADGELVMGLRKGDVALDQMFDPPAAHGVGLGILLRLVGLFATWFGFMLVMDPLYIFISLAPKLHGLLEKSPGRETGLASLGSTLAVMAPAWISFQPLATGGMALAAAASLGLIGWDIKKATPKPPPPPPAKKPIAEGVTGPYIDGSGLPGDEVYRPKKPAFFAVPAGAPTKGANGPAGPGGVYKPKRPPTKNATTPSLPESQWPEAGPKSGSSHRIERAFVFHEHDKMDKVKTAQMIRHRETAPGGLPPKVGNITGVHVGVWPKEKDKLNLVIRKSVAAYLKKHPNAPRYDDKAIYAMKVWTGSDDLLGRYAVLLAIPR